MEMQRVEIIPQLILKQEKLFDETMLKIQAFSLLVADTTKTFGENLLKSQECDLQGQFKHFFFQQNFNWPVKILIKPMMTQDLDKITNFTSRDTVFNHYSQQTTPKLFSPLQPVTTIVRNNSSSARGSNIFH